METIGLMLIISVILGVYIKAPDVLGISKDSPKVKTVRRIQILFLIVIISHNLLPHLGVCTLFSPEINDKISVGINSVIIIYFGNSLPKVPIYKNIDKKYPWAMGDERVWRKATKIFSYLSFFIAVSMFILSFYFDSIKVTTICQFIWFLIPSLYLLNYYNKKFKDIKAK